MAEDSVSFSSPEDLALAELERLGEHLGHVAWVQGAGGNCSVKVGAQLWVKASGTRFANTASTGGHARVELKLALDALHGIDSAQSALFANQPRPSLETYFHALGPRVVAHTHPVVVLLLACCTDDARADFTVDWPMVAYARPGIELAQAVESAVIGCNSKDDMTLILQSHGLLVYAPTARRAIQLSEAACSSVRQWARKFGELPVFEEFVQGYVSMGIRQVPGGVYRQLPARRVDSPLTEYLFPDAAVYSTVIEVGEWEAREALVAEQALAELGRSCVLVDPHGKRLIAAKSETQLQFACEVAASHDWVENVLAPHGAARYLHPDEGASLVNLPSEQFRLRLTAASHQG